jgi:protein SCO1/2
VPEAVSSPSLPGRKVLLGCLGIVTIAVAILLATFLTRRPDPKLDVLGEVPAFSLVDESGQPFTAEALRGRVTIVSFIFTRCDTICPITTMKMANLQEKTFDVGDRVKLVSFSVDPTYDTPERLTAYAERYKADATRWRFVTGPVDQVRALVEGPLMTSMQKEGTQQNGVPNIAHGGYFLLIDPTLHIRGTYDSNDIHRLDELIRDARFLARTML